MKKLLKLGLVVPAVLALGFGFAAFAADNSDNNSDLNRDLNEKGTVSRESQKVSASDSNPSDGSGPEANNTTTGNTADDRQIVDRRGRTPGKTAITNAAGQDRWWWGGQHHGGGGSNGSNSNDEDESGEGPGEGGETQTAP